MALDFSTRPRGKIFFSAPQELMASPGFSVDQLMELAGANQFGIFWQTVLAVRYLRRNIQPLQPIWLDPTPSSWV